MKYCTALVSFTLAAALVALGNIVVSEPAYAQARPPASGPAGRPAQARPGRPATPPRAPTARRQSTAPPQAAANRTRAGERSTQARSATGDTRRHAVNLGSTSPLNWRTWNHATRPAVAAPAPQRARQSRSGQTVAFRLHRSTAASATTAQPGRAPSVYRSAPTQRRAVANQARATQRAAGGRAAVGDGRRHAVHLGTASPVSTWSGWNRAVTTLAPASSAPRARQSGGGQQVTFREARASVELQRLRRDASGNIITP